VNAKPSAIFSTAAPDSVTKPVSPAAANQCDEKLKRETDKKRTIIHAVFL
jgi:hypothetical protein